jgi:hypothetical protein
MAERAELVSPPAQRAMSKRAGASVVEVKGSHAVYVSQPEAVAEPIKKAVDEVDPFVSVPIERLVRTTGASTLRMFVASVLVQLQRRVKPERTE